MLCPQFRPIIGGYERAAERLAGELARQGCRITVITDRRERSWPAEESLNGFVIRRLRCLYRPRFHILTSLSSHAWYLLRHGRSFDIWHVHQYGAHATLAVLLGKLLRRPVALKLTSSGSQSIDTVLATMRMRWLHRWAHRRVSACVAVSAETADTARRFGIPTARITRIPNGINPQEFRPANPGEKQILRQHLGLPTCPFAVFVGRLSPEKNPVAAIEAWSVLQESVPEAWPLYILGDGPLRARVEDEITARNLSRKVVLVGAVRAVAEWLRAGDVYVLSSRREGLSNTTMEAMASGLPCVVTAVSGMEELIARNGAGVVVPCDDPHAIANAVGRLMDDVRLREEMGANAREAAMRDYGISAVAKGHRALYAKVAARVTE